MDVPLVEVERVYHVGSMDPSLLGENSPGGSQEGDCLSVSVCPNAWMEIAKIGGDCRMLERAGAAFVDVRALMSDRDAMAEIADWAVSEGLVEKGTCYAVWSTDDNDEWRYVTCATLKDAMSEASIDEDYDDPSEVPGPDGRDGVEPRDRLVAKAALTAATGMKFHAADDATDGAVLAWAKAKAEECCGREVDGAWWLETLAPESLSAPRGGIFPEKVAAWEAKPMDAADVDDDHEVACFPETRFAATAPAP